MLEIQKNLGSVTKEGSSHMWLGEVCLLVDCMILGVPANQLVLEIMDEWRTSIKVSILYNVAVQTVPNICRGKVVAQI